MAKYVKEIQSLTYQVNYLQTILNEFQEANQIIIGQDNLFQMTMDDNITLDRYSYNQFIIKCSRLESIKEENERQRETINNLKEKISNMEEDMQKIKQQEHIRYKDKINFLEQKITKLKSENEDMKEEINSLRRVNKLIKDRNNARNYDLCYMARTNGPEDENICIICMDKKKSILFYPCCHIITCDICSSKVNQCPICREFIISKMHIFT